VTFDTNSGDGSEFEFDNNSGGGSETDDAERSNTRRRFMIGSAGAVGGLALGGAFATGSGFAGDNSDGESEGPPQGNATEGEFEGDVDILNYALTLEYLEAEFYKEALDNLGSDELRESETLRVFEGKIQDRVVGDIARIRDHEVAHVEALVPTIEDLGGEPIEMPEFDFGQTTQDPDQFLATARVLENTGVSAYAGAAPSIENADLVPPALSIHSVEARHASFLNVLNGYPGYPDAFDDPRSRAEVEEAAADFIVEEDEDGGDHENCDHDHSEGDAGDSDGSKDKDEGGGEN